MPICNLRPENPPRHGKDSTKAAPNKRKDVQMNLHKGSLFACAELRNCREKESCSLQRTVSLLSINHTSEKNMEPKTEALEDDFAFELGDV